MFDSFPCTFVPGNETSTRSFPGTKVHCVVVSFAGTKVHGNETSINPQSVFECVFELSNQHLM